MKELENKPKEREEKAIQEKFEEAAPVVDSQFAAFGEIDISQESVIVGEVTTQRFHFEKPGDRLVGYLVSRKTINMADTPTVYEVHNISGDWAFFGSKLVNGRMADVPDGVILDIQYNENKMSTQRGQNYKQYSVRYIQPPNAFDPLKHRVGLSEDGSKVEFFDAPTDPGMKKAPF